jgi:hypothetical protein
MTLTEKHIKAEILRKFYRKLEFKEILMQFHLLDDTGEEKELFVVDDSKVLATKSNVKKIIMELETEMLNSVLREYDMEEVKGIIDLID